MPNTNSNYKANLKKFEQNLDELLRKAAKYYRHELQIFEDYKPFVAKPSFDDIKTRLIEAVEEEFNTLFHNSNIDLRFNKQTIEQLRSLQNNKKLYSYDRFNKSQRTALITGETAFNQSANEFTNNIEKFYKQLDLTAENIKIAVEQKIDDNTKEKTSFTKPLILIAIAILFTVAALMTMGTSIIALAGTIVPVAALSAGGITAFIGITSIINKVTSIIGGANTIANIVDFEERKFQQVLKAYDKDLKQTAQNCISLANQIVFNIENPHLESKNDKLQNFDSLKDVPKLKNVHLQLQSPEAEKEKFTTKLSKKIAYKKQVGKLD